MNSKNASLWNVIWLIAWAVIALISFVSISQSYNRQRAIVQAKQEAEIRDLKSKNAEERSLKEQDLRAKSRETAARREAELEKVLGGSVQAAFKNSDYSLRQALHRAALAAAPTNADVRVDVDRFT